jgi:hypothetical protein
MISIKMGGEGILIFSRRTDNVSGINKISKLNSKFVEEFLFQLPLFFHSY